MWVLWNRKSHMSLQKVIPFMSHCSGPCRDRNAADSIFCYVTNTGPKPGRHIILDNTGNVKGHLCEHFMHKYLFCWGSETWSGMIKLWLSQKFCTGLCCSTQPAPERVWSFPLHIQKMFLFSQLPHLQCKLSCQGATIFPSVLIMLPLIHPFFCALLPTWLPTPAMTLFTKLTGAHTLIGPASGKSTLTSLNNWIYWPLLSEGRSYGAVQ